ncbi:heparan sulfate 2-O-sulfotransferase 1-like [Ptychodera flava]|uniref:heparan sulfate 2-O-sulfotransferase 1-like n=1 Tax=Ptychodera flava TaxID=63121 RepID=UPI003969DFE1
MAFLPYRAVMQTKYQFMIGILVLTALFYLESQIQRLEVSLTKIERAIAQTQIENLNSAWKDHTSRHLVTDNDDESKKDDIVVIYNRVPKTASTSFVGVAYDLCSVNGFNVLHLNTTRNSHVMSLPDQTRFVQNVTNWNAKKPAFYHGHLAFLDFSRFGVTTKPLYINIIRKPLDRLVSYYYFVRYGDDFRPHLKRRRSGDSQNFDDCVAKDEQECLPEKLWLQVPFFCGHSQECWRPGSKWALEQAKHNLVEHFFLVGVTEQLEEFVAVLEASLPSMFHGSIERFQTGGKSHLRKTSNKLQPSEATIAKFQRSEIWQMENEFYEFTLEQFEHVKRRTMKVVDGKTVIVPQQFMYEKIRPR